ncbi:MAG: NAD-dependent epimerase/dehydratase family protein, partial [Candidatus Binatia bacterium]
GHVIPQLLSRMRELSEDFSRKEIELPIQGTGEETRAFCYIEDAMEAILLCAVKGKNREIYHIGTGEEVAIAELAHRLARLLGIKIVLKRSERPAGGTTRRCPGIGKIAELGFEPRWSLHDGLKETIAWHAGSQWKAPRERKAIAR